MIKKTTSIAVSLLAILGLSACLEDNPDRVLRYEPGVYKGQADDALSEETRRALAERSMYQGSAAYRSSGGIPVSRSDVRPPEESATASELKDRATLQKN